MAGNSLKRGLKWYPLGPSGPKIAPRAHSVRRDGKWPIVAMVMRARVRRGSRDIPPRKGGNVPPSPPGTGGGGLWGSCLRDRRLSDPPLPQRPCAREGKRPPINNHRANPAERHTRTFKNHFISMLSSAHAHFPPGSWCHLLHQAELTVNLLRDS